jgi:hypothetical protein
MKVKDVDSQGAKTFVPRHVKNKDTEKLSAYYRFTTTELDLEATTFKEAISRGHYVTYD